MTGLMRVAPEAHGQELPNGTRLQEFSVESTIGFGGFGITYLAQDTSLGRKVVIKEHLPDMFSFRDVSSLTVHPRHSSGEVMANYEWSMASFMREAEMLASLEHPNIVRILRRFEANGTAYFVMPFVEGNSLDRIITGRHADGGHFSENELRGLMAPLLGAFAYLHDRGIYHRDVKPGNILVTSAGVPVLIDFGAARQILGEKSMTVIESAGYTPFEQTESRGNVGPWSDLYALGGVIRKAITSQTPARSADRIRRDPMAELAGDSQWLGRFSEGFLKSVDRALRVDEETRWQRAGEWLEEIRSSEYTRASLASHPPIQSDQLSKPSIPASSIPATDSHEVPTLGPSVDPQTKSPSIAPKQKPVANYAPRVETPTGLPRKKKSSLVGGLMFGLVCAGGASFGAWYWWHVRPATPSIPIPVALSPSVPPSVGPTKVEVAAIAEVPDASQWEKLARDGDAFAQALLGEAMITGMSNIANDAEGGLDWLAKSSAEKHPLGVFLNAEQRLLKKESALNPLGGSAAADGDQEVFREACKLGFEREAQTGGAVWIAALGRAYLHGLGVTPDSVKAFQCLNSAGQAGHVWSQYLLGQLCEAGRGVKADPVAAGRWYEKAAKAGWPAAQSAMARMCFRGPEYLRDNGDAFEWASKAANSGDPRGMAILGEFHESGTGVKADINEALRWYRRASGKGDVIAKGRLGRIYLDGKSLVRNEQEAFRFLKEAVDGGDNSSCFALGSMYETGGALEKDLAEAIRYYKTGANAGDPAAKNALAIHMEQGTGISPNLAEAARLYQDAAEGGIADAQLRLGLMFSKGKGVRQDKSKAADMLEKAAALGVPLARFEWGKCLESGIGTSVNETTAFKMYEESAKAGIAEAGFRAGLMLEEGRGTTKDESLARLRYMSAAEAGNACAQVNLGILYAQGRGTAKDDKEAVKWYRKAAEQDDTDGLMLLGMMCEFGHGTARNPKEAADYYRKAAARGDSEAADLLDNLDP